MTSGAGSPAGRQLNLGCGSKTIPGMLGVDRLAAPNVDIVHDLETFPWPFADDSIDFAFMDNVLEHLHDTVKTVEEVHRILKPGGVFRIIVPHATSTFAFADPTHKHFFNEESFHYFTDDFDYNFYTSARFRIERIDHIVAGRGVAKLRRYMPFRRLLMKFFWNFCDALDVRMKKM